MFLKGLIKKKNKGKNMGDDGSSKIESAPRGPPAKNEVPVEGGTQLEHIPNELIVMFASYLTPKELLIFSETSKHINTLCQDAGVWRHLFMVTFASCASEEPADWKVAFQQHFQRPHFDTESMNSLLEVTDDELTVRFSPLDATSNNRSVRTIEEYEPGSGFHYVEFQYHCADAGINQQHHPYVGVVASKMAENETIKTLLLYSASTPFYSYAGNGTMYTNLPVEDRNLGRYLDGDRVGILIDATAAPPEISFLFFVNGERRGARFTATGAFFPCIGLWHHKMTMSIVVAPKWPDASKRK